MSLTNCISIFPTPIPVSEIIHSEQVNRALGSKAAEKNPSEERGSGTAGVNGSPIFTGVATLALHSLGIQ